MDWFFGARDLRIYPAIRATGPTRPQSHRSNMELNWTFLLAIIILLYLSQFVLFAVLRIVTGISIQRARILTPFSLRRIACTPKDGVKVEIRGFRLNIHRPTFAQPTWLSIVLTELAITVDLKALGGEHDTDSEHKETGVENGHQKHEDSKTEDNFPGNQSRKFSTTPRRSRTWDQLMK